MPSENAMSRRQTREQQCRDLNLESGELCRESALDVVVGELR